MPQTAVTAKATKTKTRSREPFKSVCNSNNTLFYERSSSIHACALSPLGHHRLWNFSMERTGSAAHSSRCFEFGSDQSYWREQGTHARLSNNQIGGDGRS